jgi:dTDP-4-dehydrorhamnose reductase
MIAEVTAQIAAQLKMAPARFKEKCGTYHLTAAGQTSWFGFAQAILENREYTCRLMPIPTAEYPTPATRPAYSVLDNTKLRDAFGLALPEWRCSLQHCMGEH